MQDDQNEPSTPVEKADVEVTRAVADWRHTRTVRFLGNLSEVADQPPLIAICAATLAIGIVSRNARLARAGARMLAAELLATKLKGLVKDRVDRTRPHLLVEEGRYELEAGDSEKGEERSFPSGHTAGAVAVARAFAREYPEQRGAAYAAAGAIAAIQIPRCAHFVSDVGAGAVVGLVSEAIVDGVARLLGASPAPR